MRKSDNWLLSDVIIHGAKLYSNLDAHTTSAFKVCMEKQYAIEVDITELADSNFLVGRDEFLQKTDLYLSGLSTEKFDRYRNTSLDWHRELLLISEFLDMISGNIPIMLEIKAPIDSFLNADALAEKSTHHLYNKIKDYRHPYCIVSSNPFILKHLKALLPDVPCGQITLDLKAYPGVTNDIINMHYNYGYEKIFSADFISCKITDITKLRIKEFVNKKGCSLIVWPVKTKSDKELGRIGNNYIVEDIDICL